MDLMICLIEIDNFMLNMRDEMGWDGRKMILWICWIDGDSVILENL